MGRKNTEKRKIYMRWHVAENRRKAKLKAIKYRGGRCENCGYNKCVGAMHFHHNDPAEKDFKIGSGNNRSWKSIQQELDKCILLCANCHAEEHQLETDKKIEEKRAEMKKLFPNSIKLG